MNQHDVPGHAIGSEGPSLEVENKSDKALLRELVALKRSVLAHPVFVRHNQRLGGLNGYARNDQPWHGYGAWLTAMAMVCRGAVEPDLVRFNDSFVESLKEESIGRLLWLRHVAYRIRTAQVFLWSDEISDTCRGSPPYPTSIIHPELLTFESLFFCYETGRLLGEGHEGSDLPWFSSWMLIWRIQNSPETAGSSIFGVQQSHGDDGSGGPERPGEQQSLYLKFFSLAAGKTFPHDFQGQGQGGLEQVLKELAFIASPFVDSNPRRLPKPMQNEARRAGVPRAEVKKAIHTVTLRRLRQEPSKANEEAQAIEYHHHWWVSGHYRAQWCPSVKGHKVIWIGPHIRGPRDKPLLEKIYAVVR